ncbi:hypothetical protein ANO14919_006380 [Xylariales sp. No.14919]|nr:hypothetical protein ANO14919_006380 [Xylariales sp. No.14919]
MTTILAALRFKFFQWWLVALIDTSIRSAAGGLPALQPCCSLAVLAF